jgi:hypothetical protein
MCRAMSDRKRLVDCVYVAASRLDSRYTRISVASIRYFYPDIPIRILAGSCIRRGLLEELRQYWDVTLAKIPVGDYGWGFVKLEVLFGPPGERFLVLDSDTVLTGPILDSWTDSDAPFLVDNEAQSESATKELYYDWRKVREIDVTAQPPRFVFNSGQWRGTAGILTRDDFAPWVEWTFPRRLRHPKYFMPGDQGILNYVLNQKAMLAGLRVECRSIMRWPGRDLQGLDAAHLSRKAAQPFIVHWAGLKKARLAQMNSFDLLAFFEELYYRQLPGGAARRILAAYLHTLLFWLHEIQVRLRLRTRLVIGAIRDHKLALFKHG